MNMSNGKITGFCLMIILLTLLGGCSWELCKEPAPGPPGLSSPDGDLVKCFNWASERALSYAHGGDPVGAWYEAALPKREAFCMRDVSHQAMGAHVLGLQAHNLNMLKKFAGNISQNRDWCTYWEINRDDKPAPVDYRNDKEFWYNLPANYDLLDACYRLYHWSGDKKYIEDPVFLDYFKATLHSYEDRWDLGLDRVLNRERFMNRPSYNPEDYYQFCRGIPSYHEGAPGKTRLGVDLLAFQVAAYRSYAGILRIQGKQNDALAYEARAVKVRELIETHFWDKERDRFFTLLLTHGKYVAGGGMEVFLLYNDALDSRYMIDKNLNSFDESEHMNVEMKSYYPEIYYRYGNHEGAYRMLLALADEKMKRRDYPEVSFALVGAMVNGMMGLEPWAPDRRVATLSRLTGKTPWVEITGLPLWGNKISIRHKGREESIMTNRSGGGLTWIARFYGHWDKLIVNGKAMPASIGKDMAGLVYSWVSVKVKPRQTVNVSRER